MDRGALLYDGPSMLDDGPIVVIAVWGSNNSKTGDMIQTYILRRDVSPLVASRSGADSSICGQCPLRGLADGSHAHGRSCYVNLGQGPRAVYESFLRGGYPVATDAMLRRFVSGRMIRLGTYGDPAAVPIDVWLNVLRFADGQTGYTHQWRLPLAEPFRTIVMASVHSEADAGEARAAGWRYFRIRTTDQPLRRGEIVCPASEEAGKRRNCINCRACDGARRDGQASVVIIGHGGPAIRANVGRLLSRLEEPSRS